VQTGLAMKVSKRSGDSHSGLLPRAAVPQLPLALLLVTTTRELAGLLKPILAVLHLPSTSVEVQSKYLGTTTTVLSPRLSSVMLKHSWLILRELPMRDGSLKSVPSGSTPLLNHPSHPCTMLLPVSGNPTPLTWLLESLPVLVLPSTSSMVLSNVVPGSKML